MRKLLLVIIILSIAASIPILSKIILSSASLRVTLTIPPPALTAETPAGQYNGYSVTKTDSSIIVRSSL